MTCFPCRATWAWPIGVSGSSPSAISPLTERYSFLCSQYNTGSWLLIADRSSPAASFTVAGATMTSPGMFMNHASFDCEWNTPPPTPPP